jgi:hypothetical protein
MDRSTLVADIVQALENEDIEADDTAVIIVASKIEQDGMPPYTLHFDGDMMDYSEYNNAILDVYNKLKEAGTLYN